MASIQEILSTRITTRVVSQQAAANRYLLQLFGMQPGGPFERDVGQRQFGYDIFNDTRTVAQGRGPGTAAGTVTRQAVGRVDGVFPRFNEKLPLLSEELHNFRVIGGPNSVYDQRGVQYVLRQQKFMGQRIGNARLLLLNGMMKGKLYGHKNGDSVYYDFASSGATYEIDWKMPSTNQGQIAYNGGSAIITTSWDNPDADIPAHLRNLNAALQEETGTSLDLIITTAQTWSYILKNNYVQAEAGAVNRPAAVEERIQGIGNNGKPQTVIIGRLTAVPWITFIITNEGVKIGAPGSESFVKFIEEGKMWWGPNPSNEYFEMLNGSEPVNEGYGATETVRYGVYAYTKRTDDPAGQMLYTGDNCVPANYIPNASGYATVVF